MTDKNYCNINNKSQFQNQNISISPYYHKLRFIQKSNMVNNINKKKVHFSKEPPNIFEYEAFDQSNISYYYNDISEDNLSNYEDIESVRFRLKLDKLDNTIHQISKINSITKFEQEISDTSLLILDHKKYYTDIVEIHNINSSNNKIKVISENIEKYDNSNTLIPDNNLNIISDINDNIKDNIEIEDSNSQIEDSNSQIEDSNSQIEDKWINLSDLSPKNFLSDNSKENVNTNSTIIDLQSTSDSLCLL
ncbi:uncharacterized protein CMU_010030 [Cryptosporidium muris RN66]|uniref:Uncharacterized protein n=1 Tax=Cryptosporidium muris (strain RN66) TaxID=441375 RepID=B6AE70_CRYMR|nr:uncharacterized protein CMU_010030 [Cryptosporidium muris RN66]EEA06511.1 hypothetical protein, conserved [Cryptosporidium muris RN66]|eukprot:XP_002140860.1 hypothetical protein [Cryptosporidium muris RN66]